eukprot:1137704-Pelagomonas_calceolata.AAC.1
MIQCGAVVDQKQRFGGKHRGCRVPGLLDSGVLLTHGLTRDKPKPLLFGHHKQARVAVVSEWSQLGRKKKRKDCAHQVQLRAFRRCPLTSGWTWLLHTDPGAVWMSKCVPCSDTMQAFGIWQSAFSKTVFHLGSVCTDAFSMALYPYGDLFLPAFGFYCPLSAYYEEEALRDQQAQNSASLVGSLALQRSA